MEKALFRVGEAAEFLSVSRWTVYRWLEQGKLKGVKIGNGSTRIFRESLDGLIQDNRTDDHTLKQPSELPLAAMHSSLLRPDIHRGPCAQDRN